MLRRDHDDGRHPVEGRAGRLGAVLTAVVVDGRNGKEYRLPTDHERAVAEVTEEQLRAVYAETPFGLPEEEISADRPSPNSRGASGLPRYGFDTWRELFTGRQLLLFARLIAEIPRCAKGFSDCPEAWREAIVAYVALAFSKLTDYSSTGCSWDNGRETLRQTFARYALPMVWDYCEVNPLADTTGGFLPAVEWVARAVGHLEEVGAGPHEPGLLRGVHWRSATQPYEPAGPGPDLHRPALLRRHSLLRPDGLLPRLAATSACRSFSCRG